MRPRSLVIACCLALLVIAFSARARAAATAEAAVAGVGASAPLTLALAHGEAEPEAAAHAEGEEGHEGPVIENWWTWEHGPGKAHKHPPFGFQLINFLIFLYVLYRLAGKSLMEFVHARHNQVRRALDEAREIRSRAHKEYALLEERLGRIDSEIAELIANVRREAEAERARIIAAAEAQAIQFQKDAEDQIKAEIARARAELQRTTARAALAAAEAILRSQMQEADHKRLLDEYLGSLEGLSQPAASSSSSSSSGKGLRS